MEGQQGGGEGQPGGVKVAARAVVAKADKASPAKTTQAGVRANRVAAV